LTFIFAYAILAEAILSFLGVGPPPPAPTWGNMIAEGKDYLREAPHICLFPGIAVALVCLGLNLLGDGLRDVLDPRLRVQMCFLPKRAAGTNDRDAASRRPASPTRNRG